ncbi:52 kDa repressor of the inhibitor of the protein kinase-like [Amphibalanus amphitrite]|nr:52 kDa repressor of the inhibitor of the protein kinase-like [Amphibalanus amphitrite]
MRTDDQGEHRGKDKKASMYTIIADETTDRNKRGQLALVLRYVAEDGTVREDMVALLNPEKTTGEALSKMIIDALQKLDLSLDGVRGQGYDGGGNMSGRISGAQSRIRTLQPLAVYTHCASHRLNLALGRALTVPGVRNMLGVVSVASNFFNDSAARVQLLEEKVEQLGEEQKKKRLKALCRTRWVEQHESLLTFEQLLVPIVAALEHVEREGSSDAAQKASGHLAAITRFDFLICLEMAVLLFGITLGLSICLQNPQQSLSDAMQKINEVQQAVQDAREEFPAVMKKAAALADKLDIPVIAPRGSSRQVHRPNSSVSSDPETNYRINVFNPFIDQMIKELKERFPEDHPGLQLEGVLPARIGTADLSAVVECAEAYHKDLPSPVNLRSELVLWRAMVASATNRPQTVGDAFRMAGSLPNVKTLLQILMTLPVTSCSAERSFSTLKRVETEQRTTMGESRLESLILMSAHGVASLNPSMVADRFMKTRPRRSV